MERVGEEIQPSGPLAKRREPGFRAGRPSAVPPPSPTMVVSQRLLRKSSSLAIRTKFKGSMIEVYAATPDDLDGIMAVEESAFGPIGEGAAATRETMADRIRLLNGQPPGWFFVASHHGRVVGDVILQPTNLRPDDCTSWMAATNNGSLDGTFCPDGRNVYGVSLAVARGTPAGISELLLHRAFLAWHAAGRELFMFCSRVPGFSAAHRKTGISIEDYLAQRRKTGGPRDPLLYLYWKLTGGAEPLRLLRNGYSVDNESEGHGVLFSLDDPVSALCAVAIQIYNAGLSAGTRRGQRR